MIRKQTLSILIVLTAICLFNTGCAGMLFRYAIVGDDGEYSKIVTSLPAIPQNKGRVFIYMPEGGPNIMNTMGIWVEFSIDERIHHIAGETFFYIDLKTGKHKISANKMTTGFFKRTYQLGENVIDFELLNQEVKYVKVYYKGTVAYSKFNTYFPILIEPKSAVNEIKPLKFYKDHETNLKLGDSSL